MRCRPGRRRELKAQEIASDLVLVAYGVNPFHGLVLWLPVHRDSSDGPTSTGPITGGKGDNGSHIVPGSGNELAADCEYMPFLPIYAMLNIRTSPVNMIMGSQKHMSTETTEGHHGRIRTRRPPTTYCGRGWRLVPRVTMCVVSPGRRIGQ